ncbi:MAG: hypothetical protein L0Y50_05910 [Beijerinckiaceae bacterium]|nr:hypothetical protein [Beijerinckiaceae bacterium]MCI0735794.1 hypothetical protein [Beijerinckiaceae bacterium]
MEISCWRRRIKLAASASIVAQGLAFPGAAQAGFLDELFGQLFNPPSNRGYGAYPPQGQYWRPDPGYRRSSNSRKHGLKGVARKKIFVAARTDQPAGPLAPINLMEDGSLRKGDAVMTAAGIRVFVGYSGDHHEPEDFRKPIEIKRLSKVERKALAALDAQDSATGSMRAIVTGRSAAGRKLTVGEVITDAKGRTIRYVGP